MPRPARKPLLAISAALLGLLALPDGCLDLFRPTARAAANFVVNSTTDGADSDLADGVCNDGSGQCTLRAAVQQANALAGDDAISFSVNGTINLTSALPDLSSMTVTGPGPSQLNVRRDPAAASSFRVFKTAFSSTVSISGLTVSGGRVSGEDGGGIYNSQNASLTLTNVVLSDNAIEGTLFNSGRGGGIFNDGSALTLVDSTVSGNVAASGVFGGPSAGRNGGGIYMNRGTLTMTSSTVSGNRAGDGAGFANAGNGGGIFITNGITANLTNSTVSENMTGAGLGGQGGGIFSQSSFVTLKSCTVSNNTANSSGGGVSGNVTLRSTIVANNSANQNPDISGTVNSQDFNLIENTTGTSVGGTTTHNLTGVDPSLSPLQNNGGPTQTHALLPGSPAIDAGDSGGLTTDQRGLTRPVDNASAANASDGADIGSYEAQTPPAAGQIQFSAASYTAAESAGTASIEVTRAGGSAGAVTVTLNTSDGSATAGADYTAHSNTIVTFAEGETTKTVQITINDDALDEADETVNLLLSNPTGGATLVGSPGEAVLTILDNDAPPALSVNDVSVTEGDAGTTPANFTVTLSAPSGRNVSVTFTATTFGATASAGTDFTATTGRLGFLPGETSKTVTVPVRGDAHVEPNETFFLDLSDATNATISGARGTGTIINDDDPATKSVQFSETSFLGGEGNGTSVVTLYRTGDLSAEASVDYSTSDGTANERGDYTSAFGRLRFPAGESFASLTLLITDDRYKDAMETFTLALSNPSGVTLGAGSTTTINILDNDEADGTSPVALGPDFNASFFVRQHYRDFLNREPDASGLAHWVNEIESCGADAQCREVRRINVSAAFFLSIEFQETGYLAYRAHKAAFGNLTGKPVPITRVDMLRDMQILGDGLVVGAEGWEQKLEQNKQTYFDTLTASARFTTLYPQSLTAGQFVDALNANAGGALSQAERDALVAELNGNTKTRAQALRAVAQDADLNAAEKNKAFVLMQYFGYLRRNPDDAPEPGLNFDGWNFWLGKLNEFNGDFIAAEMVKAFLDSDEYRRRFGL